MGVNLALKKALVTCAAGHASICLQEDLRQVEKRLTWGLILTMRA